MTNVSDAVHARLAPALPLPGSGDTPGRWRALSAATRADVVVGRLLEANADADAILAEVTGARVAPGEWWGVWAAEPPQPVLTAERSGNSWQLSGIKAWCSGAGLCNRALVTARVGENRPLFAVDLTQSGVSVDLSGWHAAGMRRSATGAVAFDAVVAEPVGRPGDYLDRPGFWHGAAGVAACWFGGAERVADTLRAAGPRLDEHALAHLGAVDAALAAARWSLAAAATEVDARPTDGATARLRALRIRAVAEWCASFVIDRVGRALGATPLVANPSHTEAVSDLTLYLRQSHAERDLAGLGRLVSAQEG